MRVLFLTHQYFPRHLGGTEMMVRGLVRALSASGHEAAVITYVESGAHASGGCQLVKVEHEGCPVWEIHAEIQGAAHPALAEYHRPEVAELVAGVAREFAPDVVHAAHVMKLSGTVLGKLRGEGYPLVVSLMDYWALCTRHTLVKPDGELCRTGPDHGYRCLACAQATHGFAKPRTVCASEGALWRHAWQVQEDERHPEKGFRRDVQVLQRRKEVLQPLILSAQCIHAISEHQKQVFVRHGYPAERLVVVPLGVEEGPLKEARQHRNADPRLTGPRKIVYMGSLNDFKGAHLLLEAMQRVRHPEVRLVLYGRSGTDREYAKRLQMLAAGDPRIDFAGELPPERMGEAFRDAAALAFPTLWWSNDPLVVKAARYCGVPVAAHRLASLEAVISAPSEGWLLPPGDVAAWAEWIEGIAHGPVLPVTDGPPPPTLEAFAREMTGLYANAMEAVTGARA